MVQHPLLHADEADGRAHLAALVLPAPDTLWVTSGNLTDAALRSGLRAHSGRGYALRRLSAFQTRRGVRYTAVWEWRGEAPARIAHDLTRDAFEALVANAVRDGLSLAHVDAATTQVGPRYAAIWTKGGGQTVFASLSGAQFVNQQASLKASGHRVRQIAGYTEGGAPRFAAVFERAAGPGQHFDHAIAAADFGARTRSLRDEGYKLRDASGYAVAGRPFYTAMWEKV